jgi:hypothetical protein
LSKDRIGVRPSHLAGTNARTWLEAASNPEGEERALSWNDGSHPEGTTIALSWKKRSTRMEKKLT